MRRISMPYGRGTIEFEVDESRLAGVLEPGHASADEPEREIMLRALENPIGSARLRELAVGKRRLLVLTSDHTRPLPSERTLPFLLDEIRAGAPDAEITILVATGVHRPTTDAELREKFGDEIIARERIVVHRSDAENEMVRLGTLPSGGELWLNKLVLWAELVVAEGFIEPHFFAGFSGGRKSVLPGIASRSTVLYNHNARFIASPHAAQGVLDGNPLHRDMLYAAERAGLRFILNVLLDGQRNIVGAVAGDKDLAHRAGCELCGKLARVGRVGADIAVTSNGGYPLDQNVYQAVKGMTAAEACVKPGGAIVMCAELSDGHGGDVFFRWLAERKGPEEVLRDIEGVPPENTRMDQWEAQILARVLMKAECIFVTGEENRAMVEKMHMKWAPTVEDALAIAEARLGPDATVAVIPDGVGVIVG
ncbi:MAG: nickel-dependent lactate racemase [Clostridiales bacterium]|nr:nickel-dependent lactate racemase [Clostridiales bacterium]